MAAGLGIAVGTANSGTAVVTASDAATDEPTFDTTSRPTRLHVSPDGSVAFPDASTPPAGTPITGFVERVGDPVGLLGDDGRVHLGEDLFAAAAAALVDTAPDTDAVIVTHPTAWSSYTVGALESALERAGVSARVVPEAVACVQWLQRSRGGLDDGVVVVYDLGASTLDITVVRTGAEPSVLGKPIRSEDFGGAHFDHLVTRYVLDTVADRVTNLDPSDAATTDALTQLRRNCAAAKEALSTDTETVIPVALPGYVTDVRLVRSELEDLIRPALVSSLELVREALRSAEIEVSDVGWVLPAGGGGAIPLVAELVSSGLGLTVAATPDPALTAALGAAHLAVEERTTSATTAFPEYDHDAGEPVPEPVVPSFPSRMRSPRNWSTTRRRIAIVASAAAAIGVLTAGGLSIETAAKNEPAQSSTPASGVETSPSGGAPTTVDAVNDGASSNGTGETMTVGHVGTAGTGGTGATTGAAGGQVRTADTGRTTTAQGTSQNAPGAVPIAPESATASGGEAPGGAAAPPANNPPVNNPPAPVGGGQSNPASNGPSASDVGEGIGKAATGVGKGLGAAVTGIGTGVANIVGAVVDPVTGLLIGN